MYPVAMRLLLSLGAGIVSTAVAPLATAAEKTGIPAPQSGIETIKSWDQIRGIKRRQLGHSYQALPDLVAIASSDGDPCHLVLRIRNNGLGSISEAVLNATRIRVQYRDVTTNTLLEEGTFDLQFVPGADTLRHRNGETAAFPYNIPRGAHREAWLMVDITDAVTEMDERNNIAVVQGRCP